MKSGNISFDHRDWPRDFDFRISVSEQQELLWCEASNVIGDNSVSYDFSEKILAGRRILER